MTPGLPASGAPQGGEAGSIPDAGRRAPGSWDAPSSSRPLFWRLLLVTAIASWLMFFFLHPADLMKVGVPHFRVAFTGSTEIHELWFFDSFAILASNDAVSAGRDPYAPNPLDFQNRPHVYGPWWLHLRDLRLTRADNLGVGLVLGSAFLIVAVCWLRPRDLRTFLWSLGLFCTTPILLALERANNDLVIFLLLTPVVPCLLARQRRWHGFAVGLIAVAADLKFYPAIAALVLLAAAPPREMRWRVAAAVALLGLVAWHLSAEFGRIAQVLPTADGIFTFGAVAGLHELGWQGGWPQLLATGAGLIALGVCWRARWLEGWEPAPAQRSEWLFFILGAALLTGCFFTGQNHDYRWIFALWLAPLLWSLARAEGAPVVARRLARATGWLLLAALWFDELSILALGQMHGVDPLSALHWIFLVEQPLTWTLFLCLLVFLAHFARTGVRTLLGRS